MDNSYLYFSAAELAYRRERATTTVRGARARRALQRTRSTRLSSHTGTGDS